MTFTPSSLRLSLPPWTQAVHHTHTHICCCGIPAFPTRCVATSACCSFVVLPPPFPLFPFSRNADFTVSYTFKRSPWTLRLNRRSQPTGSPYAFWRSIRPSLVRTCTFIQRIVVAVGCSWGGIGSAMPRSIPYGCLKITCHRCWTTWAAVVCRYAPRLFALITAYTSPTFYAVLVILERYHTAYLQVWPSRCLNQLPSCLWCVLPLCRWTCREHVILDLTYVARLHYVSLRFTVELPLPVPRVLDCMPCRGTFTTYPFEFRYALWRYLCRRLAMQFPTLPTAIAVRVCCSTDVDATLFCQNSMRILIRTGDCCVYAYRCPVVWILFSTVDQPITIVMFRIYLNLIDYHRLPCYHYRYRWFTYSLACRFFPLYADSPVLSVLCYTGLVVATGWVDCLRNQLYDSPVIICYTVWHSVFRRNDAFARQIAFIGGC